MAFDSTGIWSTFFATTLGGNKRLSIINLTVGNKEAGLAEVALCFPKAVASSLAPIEFPQAFELLAHLSKPFSEPVIAARGSSSQSSSSSAQNSRKIAEANQRAMPDNTVTLRSAGQSETRPDGFAPIDGDDTLYFYAFSLEHRKLSFKERHFSRPGRGIYLAFTYEHEAIVHPGLRASPSTSGNPDYFTATSAKFEAEPNDGSAHGFGMADFRQASSLQDGLPLGDLVLPPEVDSLSRVRATKPSPVPIYCRLLAF